MVIVWTHEVVVTAAFWCSVLINFRKCLKFCWSNYHFVRCKSKNTMAARNICISAIRLSGDNQWRAWSVHVKFCMKRDHNHTHKYCMKHYLYFNIAHWNDSNISQSNPQLGRRSRITNCNKPRIMTTLPIVTSAIPSYLDHIIIEWQDNNILQTSIL
jgi:hypothetical protein